MSKLNYTQLLAAVNLAKALADKAMEPIRTDYHPKDTDETVEIAVKALTAHDGLARAVAAMDAYLEGYQSRFTRMAAKILTEDLGPTAVILAVLELHETLLKADAAVMTASESSKGGVK